MMEFNLAEYFYTARMAHNPATLLLTARHFPITISQKIQNKLIARKRYLVLTQNKLRRQFICMNNQTLSTSLVGT